MSGFLGILDGLILLGMGISIIPPVLESFRFITISSWRRTQTSFMKPFGIFLLCSSWGLHMLRENGKKTITDDMIISRSSWENTRTRKRTYHVSFDFKNPFENQAYRISLFRFLCGYCGENFETKDWASMDQGLLFRFHFYELSHTRKFQRHLTQQIILHKLGWTCEPKA